MSLVINFLSGTLSLPGSRNNRLLGKGYTLLLPIYFPELRACLLAMTPFHLLFSHSVFRCTKVWLIKFESSPALCYVI